MKTRNIMKRMIAPFIAAMALILATMYGAKEVSAANNVSISLSCAGETTKAYNVDPSFKIVASDDWIVVRKTAQDKFTITVTANTGCTSRTGYVRTYKNGQTSVVDQFTVTQWGSGHNYVTVRAVNPTCSSFGRDDTKCTKCGNVSATNQIPKTGHVTVYQSRVNPTCTAQGYDIYKCKYCSYTEKKNYQKAKGHTYKVVRDVEPTCTKEGHEYNQCTVCNYKTSGASIPKIAHVTAYQSRVNPTCTAQGYDIYKCKYCSYTEKKNYQKAKGHTYKVVRDVEPTCTKEGHEYNQCTVCNYKTSGASLPKIAHVTAYQSRVNPTCTAKGYDVYKCKNCTYTEKKNYKDAKGHTYKVVRDVEPTCTKLGHEYNQCTVCSYKTDGASIPMIEHTWKVEKKAATYTTEGYEKKYCSVCKKEEYNKKIAKLETTVNFLDGGKVVSTKKVTYGSTFGNLPTPTRSGDCQFLGWFQGTNGGIEVKSSDTVKETSGTVTLYAHWLIRVEEFVDGAGGSLTFSANDFGTDWKCFFTTNKWAPVNEGCSWIKSGPSYNSSTKKVTVSCETNTSSANRYTLLYAYETKTAKAIEYKIVQKPVPTYSITLNVNGGDEGSVPSSLTKTHGEDIDLSKVIPTTKKNGLTFAGWALKAVAGVTDIITIFKNNVNTEVYAVWVPEYEVCFYPNKGQGGPVSRKKLAGKPLEIPPEKPVRSGYVFMGWSETLVIDDDDLNSIIMSGNTYGDGKDQKKEYTKDKSITLYAMWRMEYKVTYDVNEGKKETTPPSHEWLPGSSLDTQITSIIPERDGYEFVAWNTKKDGSGIWIMRGEGYDSQYEPYACVRLYAIWRTKKVDINSSVDGKGYEYPINTYVFPGETLEVELEIPPENWGYYKLQCTTSEITCWIIDQKGEDCYLKDNVNFERGGDRTTGYYTIHSEEKVKNDYLKHYVKIRREIDEEEQPQPHTPISVNLSVVSECYNQEVDIKNGEAKSFVWKSIPQAKRVTWEKDNWGMFVPVCHLKEHEIWEVYICPKDLANYYTMRSFSIALNDALKNDWDYTKGWIKDEAFPYVREFAMDFIGEFLPAGVGGVASLGKYEAERLYAYFTKDYEAYKTGEQDQSTWLRDNVMMNGKAELAPVQTVLRFLVKDLNDVSCQDGLVIQTTPGLYVYKYEWIKTGDSEDEGYWDESCLGAYDLADPKIKTIAKVVLEKGGDFKLLYGKYSCNFGVHLTLDVTAKRIGRVPDTVYSYSWKGDKITIRPGTVGTLIDGQSEFDDLIKVDDPEKMLAILNNTDISWAQALDELREFDYSAYYLGEGIETLDPTDYIKEYKLMPPESGV